jgi:hypothetical protein
MGFRSGDWAGHFMGMMLLSENHWSAVESPIQKRLRRFKFRVTFIVTVTRSASYIFWHQPQPHPTNSPLHLVNHLISSCLTMNQSPPSVSSVTLVTEPKQVYYPENYLRDLRRIGIRLPYAPGDVVYVHLDKSLAVYSYQFDQIVKRYSTTSKGREYHYAAQFTPLGNHHGPSILSYMVPEGYHIQRHHHKPPKFLVWFRSMFLPCF